MSSAAELQAQGIKLFEEHDYEAAARAFQQAKEAYAADQQLDMAAEMKVNIGLVHRALGENQQALELMQEALRTFEERADARRVAQVLGNMGGVYVALNDKDKAYQAYRKAADTFRDLQENELYARTLLAIGNMQLRSLQVFKAVATLQVAYELIGDKLTPTQKLIKSLLAFIGRLSGNPSAA